jgi:hypothetical protein
MQYNKGTDANPYWLTLSLSNGNLEVRNEEGDLVFATQGNPSSYLNPRPFTSLEEAYDWFLTHSFSERYPE